MNDAPTQVDELELVEVADGYVVYHPERDRVHFFNPTAAIVLTLCDGRLDEVAIAAQLQELFELAEPPREEVAGCLAQLRAEDLVR